MNLSLEESIETKQSIMMVIMMMMRRRRRRRRRRRLMVDFGPLFVDSATRKCGLKDHGVDFETWSWLRDLRQSGLEDLLWTQRLFLWTQRLRYCTIFTIPILFILSFFDRLFYCTWITEVGQNFWIDVTVRPSLSSLWEQYHQNERRTGKVITL